MNSDYVLPILYMKMNYSFPTVCDSARTEFVIRILSPLSEACSQKSRI